MKLNLSILFILIPFSLFSQIDPDAMKALDKVVENMKTSESWKIEFKYTIENKKENSKHNESGSIQIKGDKYILDLLGNTLYFDGQKNYNYIKEANEVNILPPDDDTESLFFTQPSKLFTFYQEGYKSRYNGIKNETFIDIDLFPEDLEKTYFKINILINSKENRINSLKVYNKDGVQYEVEITTMKAITLDDNAFTFNPKEHPGVEIIDMTEK